MNNVTLTQPHIKLHTLPVSASPSSTHFHSMRQWNRHLSKSLWTPEAEDRREKLSVDDGTLYLNHTQTHTYSHHSLSLLSPICLLPCIIHHPPRSPPSLLSLFSFFFLFTTLILQIRLFAQKLKATPGKALMKKYTYLFNIHHKSSCDSKEHSIR